MPATILFIKKTEQTEGFYFNILIYLSYWLLMYYLIKHLSSNFLFNLKIIMNSAILSKL